MTAAGERPAAQVAFSHSRIWATEMTGKGMSEFMVSTGAIEV
jgi:hypothetical protein